MKRRTVITGLGWITSLGDNVDLVWDDLCAGKSGIGPITRWDASKYPTRFGGECSKFDVTKYGIEFREAKRLGPGTTLGREAAAFLARLVGHGTKGLSK